MSEKEKNEISKKVFEGELTEKKYDERGREQVPHWYSAAVTTGREKAVRDRLLRLAQNEKYKDQLFDVFIVSIKEESVDKKGKVKIKEKIIPGYTQYVFVKMILNNDTYNIIKIDGFRTLLPADDPQPVPDYEMKQIFRMIGRDEEGHIIEESDSNTYEIGQTVVITDQLQGAFVGREAEIVEVYADKKEVLLGLDMAGTRSTIVMKYNQFRLGNEEK